MLVMLAGIVMLTKFLQFTNAPIPILVTLLPIVTLVSPQPMNALSPMPVTLLGIVTLVRSVQPKKALPPMLTTGSSLILLEIITAWLEQSYPVIVTVLSLAIL